MKQAKRPLPTIVLAALLLAFLYMLHPLHTAAKPGRQAQPLKQDESCLACHGQAGMKSEAGKNVSIDPSKHAGSAHGILGCTDCHTTIKDFPHPARIPKPQCSTCHAAEASDLPKSIHSVLGNQACQSCHGDVHELAPAAHVAPAKCALCHAQEVKQFGESVHGQAAKAGDKDAPTCFSCHGPAHSILAAGNPAATVAKKNLAITCSTCHSNHDFLSRHRIPFEHPVELYQQSVHGRAVAAGKNAATCSDCHGSHDIFAGRDSRAKINHWNVPSTCAQCHTEIAREYLESVHGQAMKAGSGDAPVCTDCHGEHLILAPTESASPVNAAHVSTVTCGRCHSDERLARRYNLPSDRFPSYANSFHGLAMREGSQTVANCASCHGVHYILPSSDSRSTVNPANLPRTCGQCHAGAGEKFAIGAIHVQISRGTAHPVVTWIRWIYLWVIPATLGFMFLHNLLDLISKIVRRRTRHDTGEYVARMNLPFRIAHWGVMLSFPTLVFTGFLLKYPDAWWARPLVIWESRFAFRGLIHRCAAVVLIASTVYHFIHLAVNKRDRCLLKAMIPTVKDAIDLGQFFFYNLGLSKDEPKFGTFNYAEKLEYWAFLWGTVIMTLSGFMLWFNNFILRYFPKWMLDAATAVHWYEALLATFSILLWHFYMVIFDPLVYPIDLSWLNGKVPADHYRETRPAYFRGLLEAQIEKQAGQPEKQDKVPATSESSTYGISADSDPNTPPA